MLRRARLILGLVTNPSINRARRSLTNWCDQHRYHNVRPAGAGELKLRVTTALHEVAPKSWGKELGMRIVPTASGGREGVKHIELTCETVHLLEAPGLSNCSPTTSDAFP